MAAPTMFNQLAEDLPHQVHDFANDTFTVALCTNANAPVATNSVLADLTEISYTNCSTRVITTASSEGSDGTYALGLTDLVLTAGGGAIATFRHIVVYNDTPTSPANPLVFWVDYGSDLDLADTDTLTLDFAAGTITLVAV